MIRRKKSTSGSGRVARRKRGDSPATPPPEEEMEVATIPAEFSSYNMDVHCPYTVKSISGQLYPFMSNGFSCQAHVVHELEELSNHNQFIKDYMNGEIQNVNEGTYPVYDLGARPLPRFEVFIPEAGIHIEGTIQLATRADSIPMEEEGREIEYDSRICLLPEDTEEDDFDEYPAYHMGTRFWAWCRRSFMGKIDSDYLEQFKQLILDPYSQESLQRYFVNEPWKYRKKAPQPTTPKRKSLNTSLNKGTKRVSIVSEATSPQPSTSSARIAARKPSLAGYRIPNRRASDKDQANNNNKIVPIIGTVVITACRELKEGKPSLESPTTSRRGRTRVASRETSRERERDRKFAKMEVDVDDDEEVINGTVTFSPRLNSPRAVKKEKIEDDYDRVEVTGHSSSNGLTNGHSKGHLSPKRKNGEIRNGCGPSTSGTSSSSSKPGPSRKNGESFEELDLLSDIEDIDAKAIGSRIVAKLIAGGILQESSAQIFEQMTQENDEEEAGCSTKVEMSEEGKDEAEDQEVGELAEELEQLQMSLREEIPAKKALFMLTWRRAKAHFAFFHTFDELRRADYDLFKLGVNMYKEYPRKMPSLSETPLLKESLRKRNILARMHYSKMYRRHPKYRWHRSHLPVGRRP